MEEYIKRKLNAKAENKEEEFYAEERSRED